VGHYNLDRDILRRLVVTYPAAAVAATNPQTITIRTFTGHGSPLVAATPSQVVHVKVSNVDIAGGATIAFADVAGTIVSTGVISGAAVSGVYLLEFLPSVTGVVTFTATAAAAADARFTVRFGGAQTSGTVSWT